MVNNDKATPKLLSMLYLLHLYCLIVKMLTLRISKSARSTFPLVALAALFSYFCELNK